jgi:hypothetical protein
MAYNLPPAWDPGFVMPKNVIDEGLERRAFVTKWMPRGTYDDSTDGTAGYMVPQYVKDEGIGQGAFVTKWQPRGTYNGPRIPHWLNQRPVVTRVQNLPGGGRKVTVQAMGDDDAPFPKPFEDYGAKAAQALISRVATLPPGQRQATLRAIMDTVDKSLWNRTQTIFHRYVRERKISPGDAFPLALARALSAGIAAEIITTGLRGTAPQAKSLLGLGCYGCMAALGEDASCQLTPGYSWVPDATVNGQMVPGHWQRTARGATDVPYCPAGAPPGTPVVTTAPVIRSHQEETFMVGPFEFQLAELKDRSWEPGSFGADKANRATSPDLMFLSPDLLKPIPAQPAGSPVHRITPEILTWLRDRLTEAKDAEGKTDNLVHYTDTGGGSAGYAYPEIDAIAWFNAMGIQPPMPLRMHALWWLRTTISPFARTKHPTTGKDLVLHVQLKKLDNAAPWDLVKNPTVLKVWLSRVPDAGILDNLLKIPSAIASGASVAGETVKDGLEVLGNLACEAFGGALGQAAGAAAATVVGVPPQAGAAGVSIAQQACDKPPPPPPPPPSSILPTVLIAGGALIAIVLLTGKKKKKT